jgi:hypothetical protein
MARGSLAEAGVAALGAGAVKPRDHPGLKNR